MVVGAFPIAKLGTLLLRQISKPIANIVKERAKKSPFFRTYICMPPAQFYNWCEVKAKMWILDLGKPTVVPSLNEAMAIELGANLLGEGIIFVIAAGVLVLEYVRGVRKESAKEEAKLKEMDTLHYTIQELYFTTERQDAQIREILRVVSELESQVVKKPKWISPTPSFDPNALQDIPALESDVNELPELEQNGMNNGAVLGALEYLQKEILFPH